MDFSSFDKKSYKESKRRRKQAMRQSETGTIKPFRRGKKPLLIIIGAVVLVCAVAALIAVPLLLPKTEEVESRVTLTAEERLRPVNRANPLEETDVPPLADFQNVKVHAAIAGDLQAMCNAAGEKGVKLTVKRGYTSFAEQEQLYEENLAQFMKSGSYTPVRAQAAAQAVVPAAGCSEAQTGLYVEFDVTDARAKSFVERECINYGFIQRYAANKEDQTHMKPNESGYRYVGKEDAEKMRAFDMCLEEYDDYIGSQSVMTGL